MALADLKALTDSLVRDQSGTIASGDSDRAVGLAVTRYSTDRPRRAVEDLTADGTAFLALPAGWEDGFSRLIALESPPDRVPEQMLAPESWAVREGLAGERIVFAAQLPATGATVRAYYSIAHLVTADTDTVPARDREAVACWAAALLLDQLASFYAGSGTPTIQADTVDWQNKSRDFQRRAEAMRKSYLDHLGIDPKRSVAAGAVVNLDQRDSRNEPRLFKGRFR